MTREQLLLYLSKEKGSTWASCYGCFCLELYIRLHRQYMLFFLFSWNLLTFSFSESSMPNNKKITKTKYLWLQTIWHNLGRLTLKLHLLSGACLCTHWPGEGASAGSNHCWTVPWTYSLCCRHPEGGGTQGSVQRWTGSRPQGCTLLWTLLLALWGHSKGSDWDRQTTRSVSEAALGQKWNIVQVNQVILI